MSSDCLHIWPRHNFMLIGLPNPDKTFTCTLFAPWEGKEGLNELNNENNIKNFFHKYFSDFIKLCPNYIEQCLHHPNSPLIYTNLKPWNFENKILILGDAAHAVVPFYGQGMNSAFEDCVLLDELMDKYENNIHQVFEQFSLIRQPSTDALCELSLQNYVEMRSLTAQTWFVYKKKLESMLNYCSPTLWMPLYSMVSFTRIPYDIAAKRAIKQDQMLSIILSGILLSGTLSSAYFIRKYDGVNKSKQFISKFWK